jgi:hypothetical protein
MTARVVGVARTVGVALVVGTAVGCGAGAPVAPGTTVRMTPLPSLLSARCRSSPVVRAACPQLIPRVHGGFIVSGPHYQNGFAVFDLQHGVPHERRTRLNRPPAVLHLTIVAGQDPEALFGGMPYPGTKATRTLADGIDTGTRRRPVLFGRRHWAGRMGALFLAPSYPFGGQIGGHLTFWWHTGAEGYVVSLHAWEPLTECARVLRAIVVSSG